MMMTRMPISTGWCEMNLVHLRARLRVHHLRCKVHAGKLLVAPINTLPDDLRTLVAEHRDTLMLDIRMHPDPDLTCLNCGELLPPGRAYRCLDC